MSDIKRKASSVWVGTLPKGNGKLFSESGVLQNTPYSFSTRFENEKGTNPEELIAAAHAGCFNMALSAILEKEGFVADELSTEATCVMSAQEGGGFKITEMQLILKAKIPGIEKEKFLGLTKKAKAGCPVSQLLAPGLIEISLDAALV
ncbi:MAG: OsmC family protein [Anaerolineaceae bacterium]|nr:OsmC family protein [Anaerolineaceae bacterium]